MEYSGAKKGTIIIGLVFIIVSVAEFIVYLLLLNVELNFDGQKVLVSELLLNREYMSVDGLIFWILHLLIIIGYIVLGLVLILVMRQKKMEELLFAKHLILIGMFILIFTFTKLEYILLIGNTPLLIDSNYTFQTALYSEKVGDYPLSGSLWMVSIGVSCGYLLMALFVAASGVKWTLDIEKERKLEELQQAKKAPRPQSGVIPEPAPDSGRDLS
ncbi:MAG: hypothetical protein EU548_01610 [Promethearchaeota archaeon]|nr:MAG: hypothetical protein EU548_01610 [Candidatus Lokiarchaeota archaeon]